MIKALLMKINRIPLIAGLITLAPILLFVHWATNPGPFQTSLVLLSAWWVHIGLWRSNQRVL